jgi:hypothetical protein
MPFFCFSVIKKVKKLPNFCNVCKKICNGSKKWVVFWWGLWFQESIVIGNVVIRKLCLKKMVLVGRVGWWLGGNKQKY